MESVQVTDPQDKITFSQDMPLMLSAIVIASIGGTGLGFQPVMVSALIEAGGFDARAAGYIASAQVFGIATTNLAAVILGNRFNWRALCLIGLCV